MRILGIDFGLKRLGLALSDPGETIALPYATLVRTTRDRLFSELMDIAQREKVEKIVVGLPLDRDGKETVTTRQAYNFTESLKRRLSIPVEVWDEYLSSHEAEEILVESGARFGGGKNKEAIDRIAAALILKTYLERKKDISVQTD